MFILLRFEALLETRMFKICLVCIALVDIRPCRIFFFFHQSLLVYLCVLKGECSILQFVFLARKSAKGQYQ